MPKKPTIDQMTHELRELQNYILNAEGKHGARRFERALDEVPHLMSMYKPNALKQTFTGDNAKAIATIDPSDFEKYAHAIKPEHEKTRTYFGDKPEPRYEDILKHAGLTSKQYSSMPPDVQNHLLSRYKETLPYPEMNHQEYIKHLASLPKFNDMPFLYLNKEETGLPLMPEITGHEGRHRNRALASKGHKKALVQIYPRGDLREGMPRRSNEEFLTALHNEMEMTGNMVQPEHRPQVEGEVKRSPILLPDMYTEGGDVEVKALKKDPNLTRRHPKIEQAARELMNGLITQKDYNRIVQQEKPVKAYDFVPKPATEEEAKKALNKTQGQNYKSHLDWEEGHPVGLRLDINAYEKHNTWVNSIHDHGKTKRPTSYGSVAAVKNAVFHGSPEKAAEVAKGEKNKAPFARIVGNLHHMTEQEAEDYHKKYLNDPDHAQVGYDSRRHGDFWCRKTMRPLESADMAVQVGPLVLAKNPKFKKDFEKFAKGGTAKNIYDDLRTDFKTGGEARIKVQNEYLKEHAHLPVKQWPTMQEWLNKKQGN